MKLTSSLLLVLTVSLSIRRGCGFVHPKQHQGVAVSPSSKSLETKRRILSKNFLSSLDGGNNENDEQRRILEDDDKDALASTTPTDRRTLFRSLATQSAALVTITAAAASANAFDTKQSFPIELVATDAENAPDSRQRKVQSIQEKSVARASNSPTNNPALTPATAALWGGAWWLLGGSRSNPVVTPLANILYSSSENTNGSDNDQPQWLQDRNQGLFASVPAALSAALAIIFFAAGRVTDLGIQAVADGGSTESATISLQLAAVTLIGAGALELGRLAAGQKALTRPEANRAQQLQDEFAEFAAARLQPGGNCHRTDVVRAFRRYFAQYRQAPSDAPDSNAADAADSASMAVTDLEIEQLLRQWARGNQLKMSSAGFYTGIQINTDADVFVQR